MPNVKPQWLQTATAKSAKNTVTPQNAYEDHTDPLEKARAMNLQQHPKISGKHTVKPESAGAKHRVAPLKL